MCKAVAEKWKIISIVVFHQNKSIIMDERARKRWDVYVGSVGHVATRETQFELSFKTAQRKIVRSILHPSHFFDTPAPIYRVSCDSSAMFYILMRILNVTGVLSSRPLGKN